MTIQNQQEYQQKWLEIGTIVAAQGLRGEVRVYPSSDFPERFLEPGTRIASPKAVNITLGCSASAIASSNRPLGITQTGQPGP